MSHPPTPQTPASPTAGEIKVPELSDEQLADLRRLARKLDNHAGPWARWEGGTEVGLNHVQMPYAVWGPQMSDFAMTVERLGLAPQFRWTLWEEGKRWISDSDPEKFACLDAEFILKIFTALIRADRFVEGVLAGAFDDGTIPTLVARLAKLLGATKIEEAD